jgi:hypothetical protein
MGIIRLERLNAEFLKLSTFKLLNLMKREVLWGTQLLP